MIEIEKIERGDGTVTYRSENYSAVSWFKGNGQRGARYKARCFTTLYARTGAGGGGNCPKKLGVKEYATLEEADAAALRVVEAMEQRAAGGGREGQA